LNTPLGQRAPSAHAWEPVGSGFGIRAGAQLIDTLVHLAAWMLLSLLLGVVAGIYSAAAGVPVDAMLEKMSSPTWYGYLAAGLGYALYHTVMEWRCGATVGKRILGLVVVDMAGAPISWRQALGRSLAYYLDGFFFGAVALANMKPPLQQRLGDKWNGTLVVSRSMVPPGSPTGMTRFWDSLSLGLLANAACFTLAIAVGLYS